MHSWAAMLLHLQTTNLNTCTIINAWHGELVMKKYGLCCLPLITSPKRDVPQAWGALQQKNNNNMQTLSVWSIKLCSCMTVSLICWPLQFHDCQSDWLGFVVVWLCHAFASVMSCIQWRLKICMQKKNTCKIRAKTRWAKQCILSFLSRLST